MQKTEEPLLRLESMAASETTLPSGLVRETNLVIEIAVWRSPGGYPACLTASHAHGSQVQEIHLASLAQVFSWIGFQASPLTYGLRLSGEGPYRVGSQLRAMADKLVEWAATNPQKTPSVPNRSPVFFYDEGPSNAVGTTIVGFGTLQKKVALSVGYAHVGTGYRARLTACMDLQKTTLEVIFGNVDAIRKWLNSAGPQLAGAVSAGGIGDKLFQSVIEGAFVPALGRFDGNRTQPIGVGRANALRRSAGLPPLGDAPIPVATAPAETVVFNTGAYRNVAPETECHTYSDTVVNR